MKVARSLLTVMALSSLVTLLTPSLAQEEQDEFVSEFGKKIGRKKPSIMVRPEMETPEAQLAHAGQLLLDGKAKKAMKAYRALVHTWHDSLEAVTAQQSYARLLEEESDYLDAFDEYQYLMENYAGSFPYEEVLEKQFKIAHHIMTVKKSKIPFTQGSATPEKSLPLFRRIVENAPNWSKAPEAQFMIGLISEEEGDLDPAIVAYEVTQNRYPDSPFAAEAAFRRAYCQYRLAEATPRDEERARLAMGSLTAFLRDYEDNVNAAEARNHLDALRDRLADMYFDHALFYDQGDNPRAAIIAYEVFTKQFPMSDKARDARRRIEELKQEVQDAELSQR